MNSKILSKIGIDPAYILIILLILIVILFVLLFYVMANMKQRNKEISFRKMDFCYRKPQRKCCFLLKNRQRNFLLRP